jgi:hypothetical protein
MAITDASGNTALLFAADLIAFDRTTSDRVRHLIHQKHGVPTEAILLAASHTHCGPATLYRVSFFCGCPSVWYLKFLEATLLRLADEALGARLPASIEYGSANTQIGRCRRVKNEKGVIVKGVNFAEPYDTHTPILRVYREKQGKKGGVEQIVLVGHGCHPTAGGPLNAWSPDFPGPMREVIEKSIPRSRAMFVMGAGATAATTVIDKAGNEVFAMGEADARDAGERLGSTALDYMAKSVMHRLAPSLSFSLAVGGLSYARMMPTNKIRDLALNAEPGLDMWWARQMLAMPYRPDRHHYEAHRWTIGHELTLLALDSEVCPPLGNLARSMATTPHAMTVAYVNHVDAYIPTPQIVAEGGYEGESSHRAFFLPAPFTAKIQREFTAIVARAIKTPPQKAWAIY